MPDCAHAAEAVSTKQSRKLANRFILMTFVNYIITPLGYEILCQRRKNAAKVMLFL